MAAPRKSPLLRGNSSNASRANSARPPWRRSVAGRRLCLGLATCLLAAPASRSAAASDASSVAGDSRPTESHSPAAAPRWLWPLLLAGGGAFALGGYSLLRLRRTNLDLRRALSLRESLLHAMVDGAVVVDVRGRPVFMNPAAQRLFGDDVRSVEPARWPEVLGIFLADASTPCPPAEFPLARALRGESSDAVELCLRHPRVAGSRWLSITARALPDDANPPRGAIAFFTDITDRKTAADAARAAQVRLERRLQQSTAELQATTKELDALTFAVSHDLRAPVRSLNGFSRILFEDYAGKLDAEGLDTLRTIRAASQRMNQLIDELVALSRITRADLHRTEIDLSSLADNIATALKQKEPSRVVTFVIEPGLIAHADPRLISTAMTHLLGNAWKFTSKLPAAQIAFGRIATPEGPAFFVRDDGAGFDPAFAHRLFEPFQRLHPREDFPGSGIGLASVQRIVHRHGGRLWAEGVPDRGATFYFTLPLESTS